MNQSIQEVFFEIIIDVFCLDILSPVVALIEESWAEDADFLKFGNSC